MKAREILEACSRLEAGLAKGEFSALDDFERCLEGLEPSQFSESELGQVGRVLMGLKGRAEGQAGFYKIRERLSSTLSRARGEAAPAKAKIDLTF